MDALRRLIAALLIASLSLFAVGCGDDDGGDDDGQEQEEEEDDDGDD